MFFKLPEPFVQTFGLRPHGGPSSSGAPWRRPEEPKIIFSMIGVSKKIERKEILRDISLSFFYGAKIGVLGTQRLRQVLAACASWRGRDTEIDGRVHFEPGYDVGLLEQEPQLDAGQDRARLRRGGRQAPDRPGRGLRRDLGRARRGGGRGGQGGDPARGRANSRRRSTPWAPGTWRPQVEMAMDALRCPPRRADRRQPLRRRAPAGGARAAAPAASRRSSSSTSRPTTSTPRACSGSSSTSRATRAPSSR